MIYDYNAQNEVKNVNFEIFHVFFSYILVIYLFFQIFLIQIMRNSYNYGYMTFNHGLCNIGVPKCVFLSIMKLVVVDHIIIIQLLNLHIQ